MEVVNFTKFDEKHRDKWILLLNERNIGRTAAALDPGDSSKTKKLTHEAFHSGSFGKYAVPGIERSFLYHMARVTKMTEEPSCIYQPKASAAQKS